MQAIVADLKPLETEEEQQQPPQQKPAVSNRLAVAAAAMAEAAGVRASVWLDWSSWDVHEEMQERVRWSCGRPGTSTLEDGLQQHWAACAVHVV
jgi:hypothetical protein